MNETCFGCGRQQRVHCPSCGSYRCYALVRKQDVVTRPDSTQVILKVFRCTRCASLFNDDDWQLRCNAPPERLGRPLSKAMSGEVHPQYTGPDLTQPGMAEVAEEALKKLKKQRGWE